MKGDAKCFNCFASVFSAWQTLLLFLNWTQGSVVGCIIDVEAWINRLCECGVEGVKVSQCIMGHLVERQSASRPVKKHSNSAAAGTGKSVAPHFTIMTCTERFLIQTKIPGFVIITEPCLIAFSLSSNASVCNSYTNIIAITIAPLHFPVMAPSQPLPAENLWPRVKPLR